MKMDASKKKVAKLEVTKKAAENAKARTSMLSKKASKTVSASNNTRTPATRAAYGKAKTANKAMSNKVTSTKTKIKKVETDASSKKAVQKATRKKAITGAKKAVTKAVKTGVKRLGVVGAAYTAADAAITGYAKSQVKKIEGGSQVNSPKVNKNRVVHHTVFQAANRSKKK
jgi:hypothetical protein